MPSRPHHRRPTHPHLAALPSLHEEPSPASGVGRKPRGTRGRSRRGSLQLHRIGSGSRAGAIDPAAEDDASAHVARASSVDAPPSDPFHIGRTLAGRYRIEQLLGEGSMGAVVAARHLALDERVAVKFIRPQLRQDRQAVARFAREAKALARLKSEHVARLLDVGRGLGIGPYIVMEYLEGQDLGEVLRREGSLAVPRAVAYVLEACEALAVAHAAGITHQDLKPENLFLARDGHGEKIKLLDFGISKGSLEGRIFGTELGTCASPGALMGTPLYMSPEGLRNDPALDHRSDIWSLGVVLHELVTGRTPFDGESLTEICAQVLDDAPPRLELTSLPPEVEAVIRRCLCKDPGGRFQNIEQVTAALVALAPPRPSFFASGPEPVPASSGETHARQARARRWPRVAGLALISSCVAGALVTSFQPERREDNARVARPASSAHTLAQPAPHRELATPPREDPAPAPPIAAEPPGGKDPSADARPAPKRAKPRVREATPERAASSARSSRPAQLERAPFEAPTHAEAAPVGRVRLLEDRPRVRLVEDNPPLPSSRPRSSRR